MSILNIAFLMGQQRFRNLSKQSKSKGPMLLLLLTMEQWPVHSSFMPSATEMASNLSLVVSFILLTTDFSNKANRTSGTLSFLPKITKDITTFSSSTVLPPRKVIITNQELTMMS